MIAALFDADGTLYSNQMGRGIMKYAEMNGRRGAARLYYASLVPAYFLAKLKLMRAEHFQRALIARLGWIIKGMDEKEGAAVFDWVAHEYLLSTQRADVTKRLEEHQAQGHTIVIVSGVFTPCLEWIGRHFGVPNLIGTQIEVRDGRYTGRIIPPVITGADKAKQARQFLASRGVEVDWDSSYAYADSITDRELLELAGHPVAVYPDPRLHALAQARGWEVLGTPKQ